MLRLFVATKSSRRIDILNQYKVPFTLIENQLANEPEIDRNQSPLNYLKQCAFFKVKYSKRRNRGLVLACDTIIVHNAQIITKPKSIEDAINILMSLSNNAHQVISLAAILNTNDDTVEYCMDKTNVYFRDFSLEKIKSYIAINNPLDKCGGYGIQDNPPFIKSINGDFDTAKGLPIKSLLKIFHHYGIVN